MMGFEPQSVQCSDYTDYTILAPECRTDMCSDLAPVSEYCHLLLN